MELRDIKFKAKRLDNGEWIEGLPCENCDKQSCILVLYSKEGSEYGFIPVDPLTICQFTRLKDKNGKEIWKHDIVKNDSYSFEIIYAKGGFVFKAPTGGIIPMMGTIMDKEKLVYFTNIGSKFDRKEKK